MPIMQSLKLSIVFFTCLILGGSATAQDELNVISGKTQWLHYTDAKNSLYHHLAGEAYGHLENRRVKVTAIETADQWKERQQWIKKTLHDAVGEFPERSPLNARVVRTIEKDFYRVEHIVYESQPRFFVTSSLFIPKLLKKREKAPVIIYCSGHAPEGYRSNVYQHVILNLVRKGFIVFAFDPVGQGERLEYPDNTTEKSRVGGPTSEHSYPGTQAFIAGGSQARHMIWDGIRAVDYLLTRKEVDPSRIGITGRSGGGTQSAYIAAFDERIHAAAPECYITTFTRLLQSIGPQDAEQNLPGAISRGLDHGDFLIVRAPKPALMITTTRDMFSIQGARETAAEVAKTYHAYDAGDAFAMVEDDAPHASTKKNREAMYAFFQTHLRNPGNAADDDVTPLTKEEIKVTATGQVSTSLGGETVFSLNLKEFRQSQSGERATPSPEAVSAMAKELSGFREPASAGEKAFTGRIQRNGYVIEKYFIPGEGSYVIPYLLFIPADGSGKTVLYLHPDGKSAEASIEGEIEAIVRKGFTVVAPDLPGIGEMGAGDFRGDAFIGGVSHNIWYAAILVGRSIAGIHAADIIRVVNSVKGTDEAGVYGLARGELASALLHAAAFHQNIRKIGLINPLLSYNSLVSAQTYHSPFVYGAVAGGIRAYDLPQLAATLSPRKVLILNPVNGANEPSSEEAMADTYDIVRTAYGEPNSENITIKKTDTKKTMQVLSAWLE